jgi:signal transduction histidine kinase
MTHQDDLLFQIIHDFRAILRKAHTRAQLVEQRIADPPALALLAEVLSAQREMDQLLIRLAAYAGAGHESGDLMTLDTVILGAKLHLKPAFEHELVTIDTAGVRVPSGLQSALVEIIGNSIRFRKPGQPLRITIQAEKLESSVRIRVGDNGPGWSGSLSEKMFEPLQKLEASPEGFGLGLAIARRIVEGLGGRIWAEPRPDGGNILIDLPG